METITIENVQEAAFQIIAAVGEVKKLDLQAVEYSKQGKYDEMKKAFEDSRQAYANAHDYHFDIVKAEASGQSIPYSVLFGHAEDQLMSIENLTLFSQQLADVYQQMNDLKGIHQSDKE